MTPFIFLHLKTNCLITWSDKSKLPGGKFYERFRHYAENG